MFRVTSFRDRDTVQQLMYLDEADPLRRGRPGQPTTPALPRLRHGYAADQVVTRDAVEYKRRQERMWRSVKSKIKASAYVCRFLLFLKECHAHAIHVMCVVCTHYSRL